MLTKLLISQFIGPCDNCTPAAKQLDSFFTYATDWLKNLIFFVCKKSFRFVAPTLYVKKVLKYKKYYFFSSVSCIL